VSLEQPSALAVDEIRRRLEAVEGRIRACARRAGRRREDISVVVVTKGHPASVARDVVAAGARRLAENRVEELAPKVEALGDQPGLEWHLIGHIQSRKVQLLPSRLRMVHSVDRLKIAVRLDEYAARRAKPLDVLLECNVSGEPSKGGWRSEGPLGWGALLPEMETVARLPNLSVLGLMTMAPLGADAEAARSVFRSLRELRDSLAAALGVIWPHLSMGMSDDFEPAVEEGATLLRIGRAILGERPSA
jgi:pyridoxal phosphate enzyme (YggS family)